MRAADGARTVDPEIQLDGDLPRYDLGSWWERFRIVAGVTGGAPDGFDLGLASPEATATVLDRWRRFRRHFGSAFTGCAVSHQVHGAKVFHHKTVPAGWLVLDGYDGHTTRQSGLLLAVSVADCIPVYVAAPEAGAVAMLHAGWRGIAAGVLEQGIRAIADLSAARPADLHVHLGVGICGDCYEVGPDTVARLGARPGPTVDLRALLMRRAEALGVVEISTSPFCSRHDGQFHSHRRDGSQAGRMLAYLGVPVT